MDDGAARASDASDLRCSRAARSTDRGWITIFGLLALLGTINEIHKNLAQQNLLEVKWDRHPSEYAVAALW